MKYHVAIAIFAGMVLPLFAQSLYPDSSVVIGYTRFWAATSPNGGNRVSVRDSQGNIHAVYCYRWNPSPIDSSEVFHVFSTDNGLTWSEPENVSRTDSFISVEPNLAIDSHDRLHCVWKQYYDDTSTISVDYDLYYAQNDGSGWTDAVNISNQHLGADACYSSMVVDSRDYVHVVWDMSTGPGNWDIFYSFYNDTVWSAPYRVSISPYDDAFPALAVDDNDNLHVVWRKRMMNGPIMYTRYDGVSWTEPETIVSIPGGQTYLPCIVVNSQGYPRVILQWGNLPSDSGDVYYAASDGVFWSKPWNLSRTIHPSGYHSMAIDSLDNLYVVWSEKTAVMNREIYYRTYDGSTWSDIINLSQDSMYSGCPKLCNPIIANCLDLVWVSDNTYPELYVFYMKLSVLGVEAKQNSSIRFCKLRTFPNPFKDIVTIDYNLTIPSLIKIAIYDALGRMIDTVHQGIQQAGTQRIIWQPKELPTGIYFVSLKGGNYSIAKIMVKIE